MLTFACKYGYEMKPLKFFDEASAVTQEAEPSRHAVERLTESPAAHLEIGAVIARVGPSHMPQFLQTLVGMLHFGIITKELYPPINFQAVFGYGRQYLGDQRWLRSYFLKKQYFDRFQVQHYVKSGTDAQVRETSLGVFLFGEDQWVRNAWYDLTFPNAFKILLPKRGVEELQRKLRELDATLGERKYSLFRHNCEDYCMQIARGEVVASSVQIYAVIALLVILVVLAIVLVVLFAKKKKATAEETAEKSQRRQSSRMQETKVHLIATKR